MALIGTGVGQCHVAVLFLMWTEADARCMWSSSDGNEARHCRWSMCILNFCLGKN
jgi:hypothetical protein